MSDSKIDILLLGSGGREHALLTKLAESPRAGKMWVAPGNGGMDATAEVADLDPESPEGVAAWAAGRLIRPKLTEERGPLLRQRSLPRQRNEPVQHRGMALHGEP